MQLSVNIRNNVVSHLINQRIKHTATQASKQLIKQSIQAWKQNKQTIIGIVSSTIEVPESYWWTWETFKVIDINRKVSAIFIN